MTTQLRIRPPRGVGHTTLRYMRGIGVIKALLLIPLALVLIVLLAFGFFEGRKAYWDGQVRVMCERDGGVTVYERVPLPKKNVDHDGRIKVPFEAHASQGDEYVIRTIRTPIIDGYLSVSKDQLQLVRTVDKKILAEAISYGRGGGDFPTFAHPSYVSCPINVNSIDAMNQQALIR